MPIDFAVIDKNDSAYMYHIPNTWFEKPVKSNVLPRWIGWGKVKPTYVAKVQLNSKIQNVIIDPSRRLADVDMMNNVKHHKVNLTFDSKIYNPLDWKHYEIILEYLTKYRKGFYVSHTCRKVILEFEDRLKKLL